MNNQKFVKSLIDVGNGLGGHRVSGSSKAQIKSNIKAVFVNARKRIKETNIVD